MHMHKGYHTGTTTVQGPVVVPAQCHGSMAENWHSMHTVIKGTEVCEMSLSMDKKSIIFSCNFCFL